MNTVTESYRLTEEEYSVILECKRDLHMHPELSRREYETTRKIRSFLEQLPDFRILPVRTATGTGLAARIEACGSSSSSAFEGAESGRGSRGSGGRVPEPQCCGSSSSSAFEGAESGRGSRGSGGRVPEPQCCDSSSSSAFEGAESGSGSRVSGGRVPETQCCGSRESVPEIMLRADIDALPQTEEFESPWKSRVPGVMHACGHDFHTASLLGAALLLQRAKKDGALKADVDLVFQPAEEGTTGAGLMIEAGLFEQIHPDLCFGIHNWPSVQAGRIACHEGPLMSGKRNFEIVIHGAGGHGSMPHLSIDPIVCAAAVVQSLQTVVSRNTNPLDSVILTINMIEGGSPMNLIADSVRMLATVRSLSDDALDRAIGRVQTIVESTAEAYECRAKINWNDRIPAVWNSPEMTELARECAAAAGCEVTDAPPSLASEDFARYRAFVPSFFYWVGSTAAGEQPVELHKPLFHTDDTALRYAAELYAASVMVSAEKMKNRRD